LAVSFATGATHGSPEGARQSTRLAAFSASACFCVRSASFFFRCLFGAKVKDLAGRFAARRQIGGDEAGPRPLQIGEKRALRVGGNGGNRLTRRAETEPV
jgi:hypothetical protein